MVTRVTLREVVSVMTPWYVRSLGAFGIVWTLAPRAHRFDIAYYASLAVIWFHIVLMAVDTVRLKREVLRAEREIEAIRGATRE